MHMKMQTYNIDTQIKTHRYRYMYVHAHMTYRQREGNTHTRARIYIVTYRQKDTHANIHVSTACPNIYNYTHMQFPTSMLMPITGCDHLTVLHTQTPVARHHCVAERGSACCTQCTPVLPARSLRTGSTGRLAQAHTRSRTAWRSAMTSKASMEGILHKKHSAHSSRPYPARSHPP